MYSTNQENDHLKNAARHANQTAANAGRRVKEDVRDAAETVSGAAGSIREDIEVMARHAGSHVRDVVDNIEHHVSETTDTVMSSIKERPMQSSLIALGVGFVMGLLLRRK